MAEGPENRTPDKTSLSDAAIAPPFSVVINYFSTGNNPHLRASAQLSASLSIRDPLVREVIVVDGSEASNSIIDEDLTRIGVRYHHAGRRLTFAEGYNLGARLTSAPWLVLCASDVYPSLDFYGKAHDFIRRSEDAVGCIIPRLTTADLPIQESLRAAGSVCTVPLMTLNLNIFNRNVFFALGGVPEQYSGAYNDVEMSIKIKESGRAIYMIAARCCHFGRLTLLTASSDVSIRGDREKFYALYPRLASPGGFWDLDIAALCEEKTTL